MSPWRLNGSRCWRPRWWWMKPAGTGRSARRVIRISGRADTIRRDSAIPRSGSCIEETIEFLFSEYRKFSELTFQYLVGKTPKPPEMTQEAYERTLRARAFDISRYLLPLATNTSLGQIVNCAHPGDAGIASARQPLRGGAPARRADEAGRARSRLGRERREAPSLWWRPSPKKTQLWGNGPARNYCARPGLLPRW